MNEKLADPDALLTESQPQRFSISRSVPSKAGGSAALGQNTSSLDEPSAIAAVTSLLGSTRTRWVPRWSPHHDAVRTVPKKVVLELPLVGSQSNIHSISAVNGWGDM